MESYDTRSCEKRAFPHCEDEWNMRKNWNWVINWVGMTYKRTGIVGKGARPSEGTTEEKVLVIEPSMCKPREGSCGRTQCDKVWCGFRENLNDAEDLSGLKRRWRKERSWRKASRETLLIRESCRSCLWQGKLSDKDNWKKTGKTETQILDAKILMSWADDLGLRGVRPKDAIRRYGHKGSWEIRILWR